MQNPMAKLVLDHWYKVMIGIGGFVFLLNGAGLLPAYPTGATALIAIGVFLWGIGEWINHPYQEILLPGNFGQAIAKLSGHPRKASGLGIIFDVIGLGSIAFGIFKIL